jgi:hypothetical protein
MAVVSGLLGVTTQWLECTTHLRHERCVIKLNMLIYTSSILRNVMRTCMFKSLLSKQYVLTCYDLKTPTIDSPQLTSYQLHSKQSPKLTRRLEHGFCVCCHEQKLSHLCKVLSSIAGNTVLSFHVRCKQNFASRALHSDTSHEGQ